MRFGTIVAAWRQLLDADGNGRLSFGELCHSLRTMSFHGDMTDAWQQLDKDNSGLISLDELDPEAESTLRAFREYLTARFDGLEGAWLKGFDIENTKRVDQDQFIQRCLRIGYGVEDPTRLRYLFKLLIPEKGKKYIYLDDFSTLMIGVPTGQRDVMWYGAPKHVLSGKPSAQSEHESKLMGAATLKDFKVALIQRFGTIVCAWRVALDSDGNGRLSFGELCEALRWLSFHGDMKQLWNDLDKDASGLISLDELDPEADTMLREFREFLIETYGGIEPSWSKGFDVRNIKRIDLDQFVERCGKIGFAPNWSLKKLFKVLLPERGKKHIVIDDLQTLLIGVPTSDRKAAWRGTPIAAFK